MKNIADRELDELFDWTINEDVLIRTRYPKSSYEDGIRDVIKWMREEAPRPDIVNFIQDPTSTDLIE